MEQQMPQPVKRRKTRAQPARVVRSIEITPRASEAIARIQHRYPVHQKVLLSRVIQWFAVQPAEDQLRILAAGGDEALDVPPPPG